MIVQLSNCHSVHRHLTVTVHLPPPLQVRLAHPDTMDNIIHADTPQGTLFTIFSSLSRSLSRVICWALHLTTTFCWGRANGKKEKDCHPHTTKRWGGGEFSRPSTPSVQTVPDTLLHMSHWILGKSFLCMHYARVYTFCWGRKKMIMNSD